ncbi:MAG TPA: hypothetical protein VNN15_08395 [Solirubrobacterales bacterium]|nr:hypothetical protein [Solirubrobacterales bacterium]
MAQGGKEHKMLFDIRRGRRKTAVKVVYAVLAVLMGLSLFLVVGPVNIGEIFGSNGGGSSEVIKSYEEQAERTEAKLRKDPENPDLLLALARTHVTAGNTLRSGEGVSEEDLVEALQQYQQASSAWSEYLEATEEPSAGVAQLMAPALLALAEASRSTTESASNVKAAAEAQKIAAEQRPTLNSLYTLSLYTYFTGDYAAAEKAEAEAVKQTKAKFERESVEKQLKEAKERSEKFLKEVKKVEAAENAAAKANNGKTPNLSGSANPLNGAFGTGSGLGE